MEFTNVGGTDLWGDLFIILYGVGTLRHLQYLQELMVHICLQLSMELELCLNDTDLWGELFTAVYGVETVPG